VVNGDRATAPEQALAGIARELRAEGTVVSAHVVEPSERPLLGLLVAAGPRCRDAAGEYAGVIERIREGYLLHYGRPRILDRADRDLALLAGDHLYALGLERLAVLGDLDAVSELADLISLCAQLHSGPVPDGAAEAAWLGAAVAIAAGTNAEHEAAKEALRAGAAGAAAALRAASERSAAAAGLAGPLEAAAKGLESGAGRPA
jgi:hypothetical protein